MKLKTKFKKTEIGKIPENWEVESLSLITKNITDGKHGDCTNQKASGYFFISCKDVINGNINYENARQITEEDFIETHKRTKLEIGDILLTNSGTIGRLAIAKNIEKTSKTTFQKSVAIIKPDLNKINSSFLYYALLSQKRKLIEASGGTTQKNLLLMDIRKFEIGSPKMNEQKAIAKILSDLDSKIELNQQMNKTLEAIGQALFKHWFVDFEFPNEEGKPYKSSGGEIVDSELGKIPKGWEVSKIGEEFETILGGTPSTTKKSYWENGTIAWINSGEINKFRITEPTAYITKEAVNNSATQLMPKGTTVLAITGATLGQVSRIEIDACANQSVIGIIENTDIPSEYIYLWTKHKIIDLISNQTGGAQQHINKNNVDNSLILIPEEKVIDNYKRILVPIFDKILDNSHGILILSQIRDSLLPKLMSGKIRVPVEVKE